MTPLLINLAFEFILEIYEAIGLQFELNYNN